jgi:hypothetical protein
MPLEEPVSKMREPYISPRFQGERFEGGVLPVDVLAELQELRALLLDVAKYLYRTDNPSRKRVPRGFEGEFRLVLTGIGAGSAIPALALEPKDSRQTTWLAPDESVADYFEKARTCFIQEIEAANTSSESRLPKALIQRFDRFGRRLMPNDSVGFLTNDGRQVEYTQQTRQRLMLRAGAHYRTVEADLTGPVVGVDEQSEQPQFKVWLTPTVTARINFAKAERDEVIDAFQANWSTRCRLRAAAVYNEDGTLKTVGTDGGTKWSFEDAVGQTAADRVEARIQELQALRLGWFDGCGAEINPLTLKFVRACVVAVMTERPDVQPYLYPTPEGGVRLEYSVTGCDVSAEFEEPSVCYFHRFEQATKLAEERELRGTEWDLANSIAASLPPIARSSHEH